MMWRFLDIEDLLCVWLWDGGRSAVAVVQNVVIFWINVGGCGTTTAGAGADGAALKPKRDMIW